MTRQEFSEMLVKARKLYGKTQLDVCIETNTSESQVWRIEKGLNNYKVSYCYKYLNVVGALLIVLLPDKQYRIPDYDSLMVFIKRQIDGKDTTYYQFAKTNNISPIILQQVMTGKITMTINVLLKLANALDFTLSLGRK